MSDNEIGGDEARRARQRLQYGRREMRRAAALVRAFVTGDLGAVHSLGPAKQELPQEPGVVTWLDELNYPSDQAQTNPDHELVFALVHLVLKVASKAAMDPATFARTLDRWLSVGPSEFQE